MMCNNYFSKANNYGLRRLLDVGFVNE